jgi:hypothetical protein
VNSHKAIRDFFKKPTQEQGTPFQPIEDKERIAAEDHAGIKAEAMKKEDKATEKGSGQSNTFKNCQFHNCKFY